MENRTCGICHRTGCWTLESKESDCRIWVCKCGEEFIEQL